MYVFQLQRWFKYATSLFGEGSLYGQFTQPQQLQNESSPDFMVQVVFIFFEDSMKLLNDLSRTLDQWHVDFKRVDSYVHQ